MFEARDLRTSSTVALKVFPHDDHDQLARLRRAAASAREWRHPHVIQVNDAGEVDGMAYLDMAFIDAPTLRDMLGRDQPLSYAATSAIVTQVAATLDAANAAGLNHFGLAPQRIFVTGEEFVYVSPFGLAEPYLDTTDFDAYIAPERRRPGEVTRSADIYALARVLVECVTRGGALAPPPALADVIACGMATDPAARYATAGELAAAAAAVLVPTAQPAPAWTREAAPRTVKHERALPFHDDVQFTVYRPRVVRPLEWTSLLAFAHLGEAPLGTDLRDDPIAQVERRAQAVLGDQIANFAQVSQDSSIGLPEESEITFALDLPGFDIKAPNRTFSWVNAVHMEEFQIRAASRVTGTARGRLLIMHGSILLAEVRLAIRVDPDVPDAVPTPDVAASATPFRKIFPSYSHVDTPIVMQFERYLESLGDRYLRDVYTLRAGERWSTRLRELIDEADVFQLFWSHNSMRSRFVADEWNYALSLHRADFVRPTYWEQPMPTAPGLPPADLGQLHFHPLGQTVAMRTADSLSPSPTPMPAMSDGLPPMPPSPMSAGPPPAGSSPPPAESRVSHGRLLAAGLTAVAASAVAGVLGMQALGGGAMSSPPSTLELSTRTPTPQHTWATPASPPNTWAPPTSQVPVDGSIKQLLTSIPENYAAAESCRAAEPHADALATADCAAPPAKGGPTTVTFSLYPSVEALDRGFEAAIADGSGPVACQGGDPSPTDWHYENAPDQVAGRVACVDRPAAGRAGVVWTIRHSLILANAQAGDLPALYAWWRDKS